MNRNHNGKVEMSEFSGSTICGIGVMVTLQTSNLPLRVRVPYTTYNNRMWLNLARALALGARGYRFKSCHPDISWASMQVG